ncbi:MAG: RnfABCDGE type electron transport complex subunit D [Clostridia bacterium]
MEKLIYGGSPHIRSPKNTKQIMIEVCIALLPATVMGCVFFGINAILIILTSIVSSLVSELVFRLCQRVPFKQILSEFDFTSLVTGLLIGLNMPAMVFTSSWYIPVIASVFAIVIVKMLFGGTGRNLVNPAIAGRIMVIMSFAKQMNYYPLPNITSLAGSVDIVSGATPLTVLLNNPAGSQGIFNMNLSFWDLLLGSGVQGVIGETCRLALIIGGIYLVLRGIINFRWPLVYIVVTGLMTVALKGFNILWFLPSILSGGLMLGAIFMANDYVTTPNTRIGNYVYFIFLGVITATLRVVTTIETVSFAILLGNLIVPLIDKFIVPKPFGSRKEVAK